MTHHTIRHYAVAAFTAAVLLTILARSSKNWERVFDRCEYTPAAPPVAIRHIPAIRGRVDH